MGRRSQARRLNLATQQEREEEFDVEEWLVKPKQKATREEVYALLRQYHWEYGRARLRARGKVGRFLYAVWLAVSFPFRVFFELVARPIRRRRRKSDLMLAKEIRQKARELGVAVPDPEDYFERNEEGSDES